jgi:hypothetical protein
MAPGISVAAIRTGVSTLPCRFRGRPRSHSSPPLRCGAVGSRPAAAAASSRPGHERRARRGACRSVRLRSLLMPCSMPWTTNPGLVFHRVRLARRRARYRWSSSYVASSMPSWLSATTPGITHRGFSSSRRPADDSPIEPVDGRAIRAAACTRTPPCTLSCSPRWATRRGPNRPMLCGRTS